MDRLKPVVVFDLDGTLVEFPRAHLFSTAASVFEAMGLGPFSEEEYLRHFSRFDFFALVPEQMRAECAEFLARELERLGHPLLKLFPDSMLVLDELSARGHRLAIATARVVSREQLEASLAEISLAQYFEAIVTRAPHDSDWKDKGPQIRRICAELQVEAEQLCFVGDIPSDISSARAAGVTQTVAVCTGGIETSVLAAAAPTYLFDRLGQLLRQPLDSAEGV